MIIGENGSGKTSILEAVYEALKGKSFRATDVEILKKNTDFYRVELLYKNNEKIIILYNKDGVKQFLVGDKKTSRLPRKNKYPIVLFLPDDLYLIGSSPTRKRDFFDKVISGLNEKYSTILNRYNKVLKQRNDLLKKYSDNFDKNKRNVFFSWNVMLARYGIEIREIRKEIIENINNRITEIYRSIARNNDEIKIDYELKDGEISEQKYIEKLEKEIDRDIMSGHTGFGIHRDNYNFIFNDADADGSASRGEIRSIMIALKFIEAEMIYENTGKRPVILLDDVFSELDNNRQESLMKNFKDNQILITSTEIIE